MISKARALCCAFAAATLLLNLPTPAFAAADRGFATVGSNVKPTTDVDMGEFTSSHMSVQVVLAPRDASGLSSLLADLYNTNNTNQHWLGKGEFYSRFAPDPKQAAAVADYLRKSGLDVEQTSSPFLLRVSSTSNMMEETFRTALHTYRNRKGVTYFTNASEIQFPEALAPAVLGVVGLSNTVRLHSQVVRPARHTKLAVPSCEAPYVTTAQLYNAVNNGVGFPLWLRRQPGMQWSYAIAGQLDLRGAPTGSRRAGEWREPCCV